jgi:hypothetical protein
MVLHHPFPRLASPRNPNGNLAVRREKREYNERNLKKKYWDK